MLLYYLFPINKSVSKIYLHSHENRKERNFISKTRVEKFVFFPLRERLLPFNILSSNWNLTRNPRSHPPSKGICTTSTILHRRYKNSTVTVMERRSLLPCLYTHEWRSNGKKRFLALGERSGKAGDTHAHKIGSASPRLPSIGYFENVDSIDGFWSVEEEGIWYAWKGVRGYACYFVETDLFRGCLTLKWYAPGIQKGEGRRGEGRWCKEEVFARSKEGRIRGIYMYFPFVCDPLDRGIRGGKKGERKGKRKWTFVIDHAVLLFYRDRKNASFLSLVPFPEGTHDLEAQTPAPPRSYFCKALFFRNAGPTIVFPVPPLRSSSLCSIPSIWSRYIRRVSLSLSLSISFRPTTSTSLTPSNSFRCRHPSSLPARRVGLESVLRGELERRDDGVALLLGQLYRFEENMDTCWSMSRRVFNAANQKLENSYYPSIFARNIRILYI